MADGTIEDSHKVNGNFGYPGQLRLSFGRSIGLRLAPTVHDLRFSYEETPLRVAAFTVRDPYADRAEA